jgi:hypothetical protein
MDLGSGIRKKPIPDPGSRGQKGTGSRIRNTAAYTATLLVMVNVIKGGGRAPPTLTSPGKFYPHD